MHVNTTAIQSHESEDTGTKYLFLEEIIMINYNYKWNILSWKRILKIK